MRKLLIIYLIALFLIKIMDTVIINSGFERVIRRRGIDACSTLRNVGLFGRLLRSTLLRVSLRFKPLFFSNSWIKELESHNVILLFDGDNNLYLTNKIANIVSDKRLIFFYWNPIKNPSEIQKIGHHFEIWTSDYNDSVKYRINYSGQFVFDTEEMKPKEIEPIYDFYFVGLNKGRFDHLCKLKRVLIEMGMNPFFRFVDPVKSIISNAYSHRIPYSQVLSESSKAKAIIEYNQEGQVGLTLRAIESIIMQKKLITNNTDVKNYSFYRSNNIFIVNSDNLAYIKDFMEKPFERYSNEIVKSYTFEYWFKRIIQGETCNDRIN